MVVVKGESAAEIFELRDELLAFFMDVKKRNLLIFFDQNKMCLLAYVTDIFGKLNELKMSRGVTNI